MQLAVAQVYDLGESGRAPLPTLKPPPQKRLHGGTEVSWSSRRSVTPEGSAAQRNRPHRGQVQPLPDKLHCLRKAPLALRHMIKRLDVKKPACQVLTPDPFLVLTPTPSQRFAGMLTPIPFFNARRMTNLSKICTPFSPFSWANHRQNLSVGNQLGRNFRLVQTIATQAMNVHILIISLILVFLSVGVRGADPILELVALEQKTLAEKGISAFYEIAESQGWNPPQIKSKWAISHVADRDEKARLNAQFELGQNLLRALPDMLKAKESAGELQSVQRLMAFAGWMASKQCYGNALIARRAFDLTLPVAGQLATHEGSTDETLAALQTALNPDWATTAFASAVLDDEAGAAIFAVAKNSDDLRLIWADGVRKAIESKDPNWAKSLPAGFILPGVRPDAAKIANEALPFFVDDPLPQKPTTEALLSGKHHRNIVAGIEPVNASHLRSLIAFRHELKAFPDETVKSDFYPGLKGAFDAAWRRHYKAKSPQGLSMKLGLAAWATYDAIKHQQFMPDDEVLGGGQG